MRHTYPIDAAIVDAQPDSTWNVQMVASPPKKQTWYTIINQTLRDHQKYFAVSALRTNVPGDHHFNNYFNTFNVKNKTSFYRILSTLHFVLVGFSVMKVGNKLSCITLTCYWTSAIFPYHSIRHYFLCRLSPTLVSCNHGVASVLFTVVCTAPA